jgi:RNA polymerase sigma-70 factor (ECF subfamily)
MRNPRTASLRPVDALLEARIEDNTFVVKHKKHSGHKQYSQYTDMELVEVVRAGNNHAFGELFRRYRKKVTHLALKITRNEVDAQEVVQDVFLKALAKLHTFKGDAAFSSWLYRVTTNSALMLLRSRKYDDYESWDDNPMMQETRLSRGYLPADWRVQADRLYERKEITEALHKSVATLPKRYRNILELREFQGMKNKEIAEELDLSVAAVKSRLHRARLVLRDRLAEHSPETA